jgi:hypothetical protein
MCVEAVSSETDTIAWPPGSGGLLEWLDEGANSQGERYAEMRRRLVWYFERWNRHDPPALADETFRRIGGMLAHAKMIGEPPARYCYLVAREVLVEDLARHGRHVTQDPPRPRRPRGLDRRLQELPPAHRELVVEYYRDARPSGSEHRRRMAERLGLTSRALGERAARIREGLARNR